MTVICFVAKIARLRPDLSSRNFPVVEWCDDAGRFQMCMTYGDLSRVAKMSGAASLEKIVGMAFTLRITVSPFMPSPRGTAGGKPFARLYGDCECEHLLSRERVDMPSAIIDFDPETPHAFNKTECNMA